MAEPFGSAFPKTLTLAPFSPGVGLLLALPRVDHILGRAALQARPAPRGTGGTAAAGPEGWRQAAPHPAALLLAPSENPLSISGRGDP